MTPHPVSSTGRSFFSTNPRGGRFGRHRAKPLQLTAALLLATCVSAPLFFGSKTARAADSSWATIYPAGAASLAGRSAARQSQSGKEAGEGNGKNEDKLWEVDSEHIFGFTQGSDIGEKGELEFETEPTAAIGKRFGTYFETTHGTLFKYSVTDDFRVSPGFAYMTHEIRHVPGFDDRQEAALSGVGAEIRYRLMNREKGPFGVTFTFEPGWSRIDELTDQRVQQYGTALGFLLDKELIHNRLYGALNFFYEMSANRLKATGEWFHDSAVETDVALSYQYLPGKLLGLEARYAQQYEGMGLNRLKGEALYVGPTFFFRLGDRANISGAFDFQVAGKAVDELGALDLVNFDRYRCLLRLAILLNPKD